MTQPTPKLSYSVKRFMKALGPGLISGAADDDPSGIVTYSMAGAQHGMGLLWMSWATWPLMSAIQMMCARIGMVTGRGLASALKLKFPKSIVVTFCIALFIANTINVAADLSGMADAAELLTGISSYVYVALFGAFIGFMIVRCTYQSIANILKWLVIALVAYVITAFLLHPKWGEVANYTFFPEMPKGQKMWETIVAILGTTISPYLFFWQAAQEVEEEKAMGRTTLAQRAGATKDELVDRMMDVTAGTLASNIVMFFIILAAALTLNVQGITEITSSRQAAEALKPLAGDFATALYALGIIATGMLAIPTLAGSAGYAFSEALNWKLGLDKKLREAVPFYGVILLSIILAVVIDAVNINPMQALFWSAVVNGVLAPFLMVGILLTARDKRIMHNQPSSVFNQIIVTLATLAMFGAVIGMFYMMLGT